MRNFFRTAIFLFFSTASTLWCDTVYTSSYDFETAVQGSTQQFENFSSVAPGTSVSNGQSIDGITYSSFTLTQGATGGFITDLYNSFSGNSLGANHAGSDQFFSGTEGLTIRFATPVTALGVFFNVSADSGYYGVTAPSASVITPSVSYDLDTFVFAGLVSGTPFTTATVYSLGPLANYTVPGIVSVATPEPSSWLLCGTGACLAMLAFTHKRFSFGNSK